MPGPATVRPDWGARMNPLDNSFHVRDYGAVFDSGTTDNWAFIQNALDDADNYNRLTHTFSTNNRGGIVIYDQPTNGGTYGISAKLIAGAGIIQRGGVAAKFGRRAVELLAINPGGADTGVGFTNTEPSTSNPDRYMMVLTRVAKTGSDWFHAGELSNLTFNCNNLTGLGGVWGLHAGELSEINKVRVINSGKTVRSFATVNFTADSTQVTVTGGDLTDDDLFAPLQSAGFPTYTDKSVIDAVTTAGSPVVTSATGGFSAASHKGAEVTAGNASFFSTAYIVSVDSATQVTMSEPAKSSQTARSITWGQPRYQHIAQVDSATQFQLTRPSPVTITADLTVERGAPAMRLDGWSATGRISELNLSNNNGPGLVLSGSPSNFIGIIAGDNNVGPLIHFYNCSPSQDNMSVTIDHIKCENNLLGGETTDQLLRIAANHDPVVQFTKCGFMSVTVRSMSTHAGFRSNNTVFKSIQGLANANANAGWVSLKVENTEGDDPFNQAYRYIFKDSDVPANDIPSGAQNVALPGSKNSFPDIHFHKDIKLVQSAIQLGNGSTITDSSGAEVTPLQQWRFTTTGFNRPNKLIGTTAWQPSYDTTMVNSGIGFNSSNAQNDEIQYWFPVSKGTYRFELITDKFTDRAIQTWEISHDGGQTWAAITTFDGYNATRSTNQIVGVNNISVPKNEVVVIRCRVATRNASNTTGWIMVVSNLGFIRTA